MYTKCYKLCFLEKQLYVNPGHSIYSSDGGKTVYCVSYASRLAHLLKYPPYN